MHQMVPINQILISTRCKDFIMQNLDNKIKTVHKVLAKTRYIPNLKCTNNARCFLWNGKDINNILMPNSQQISKSVKAPIATTFLFSKIPSSKLILLLIFIVTKLISKHVWCSPFQITIGLHTNAVIWTMETTIVPNN